MLARLARAGLVIPDVQVYQLDLDYAYYAFALFHRSAMNRVKPAVHRRSGFTRSGFRRRWPAST